MNILSERFVNKLYKMANSISPVKVSDFAKKCFIDYLGVTLAGCKIYSDVNERYIKDNQISGKCHIIGNGQMVDLHTAVMINAFNAHVLELDDSHRVAMTHLGAPIFSALVGVAEVYNKTIDDILNAAIVGYEAAIRLANSIQPGHKKRGFHVSGTCCTVGCAMGIASMLKYTKKEMYNVFSAAVTSAAGLLAVISGASEQKPYNVANAAVAGVNAALYGKNFIGAVDILGDSRGFFHAMTDEVHENKLFEEGYAMVTIYQKIYAACRHCHAPIEAMLDINCKAEKVSKIEVFVYDLAIKGHDHRCIEGVSSAKQSIPYTVAVACVRKNCGISAFTNETINDESVLNLAKRVFVIEDPIFTSMVPEKRAAKVIVYFNDGSQAMKQIDYPKGEPENPITVIEMEKKYYELMKTAGFSLRFSKSLLDIVEKKSFTLIKDMFEMKNKFNVLEEK